MKFITASKFKATCLKLMDRVNTTGEEIIITKNGRPVSVLKPYKRPQNTIFGMHKERIKSIDDLTEPLEMRWDVE